MIYSIITHLHFITSSLQLYHNSLFHFCLTPLRTKPAAKQLKHNYIITLFSFVTSLFTLSLLYFPLFFFTLSLPMCLTVLLSLLRFTQ